jgi:hypothetical protein
VDWKDEEGKFHDQLDAQFGIEQMKKDDVMT